MAHFPVDEVEALLILKAQAQSDISYGEVFAWFGLPFQRWQVGGLCAVLGEVDRLQRGRGRPDLAVLVVRQSDRIPGQGWWLAQEPGTWSGPIEGPEARQFVETLKRRAYDYWREDAPVVAP
ncbi:MAG: ribose-phosphate pyrophosphokinase [Sphingomonadaceae bacterium]